MVLKTLCLSGQSAGGWALSCFEVKFSKSEIDGVIAFHPAQIWKICKNQKILINGWVNWRKYKISLIRVEKLDNVLVYSS